MNEQEQIAMTIMAQIRAQDPAAFEKWRAYNYVHQGKGEDWFGNKFRGALGFQVKGTKLPRGKVHIQLNWLDTYRVMFIDQDPEKLIASEDGLPPCEVLEGIYFDQLVEVIDERIRVMPTSTSQEILADIIKADFTALKAWGVNVITQFGPGKDKSGIRHKGGIALKMEAGFVAIILLIGEGHYKLIIAMKKREGNDEFVPLFDQDKMDAYGVVEEINRITSGDPWASLSRMIEELKTEVENDAQSQRRNQGPSQENPELGRGQ